MNMGRFINCFLLAFMLNCVDTKDACSSGDVHALILARGGSKGIRYKNLVEINGYSLLARTILTIRNSNCFEYIWVSTDNDKIALEAIKFGAIVHKRPAEYARDETSSIESIQEFLRVHKTIEKFALFQCTSVFLREKYIKEAVHKFKNHNCVFSVKRSHNLRWKIVNDKLLPVGFDAEARPRRQDWPGDMVEAGMFYFANKDLAMSGILQSSMCAVVEIDPDDGMEIDSHRDLKVARCILKGGD